MRRIIKALHRINDDESGHIAAGVPSLVAGVGAVVLGIGAGGGGDEIAIIGGVILGIGVFGAGLARHRNIDYEIFSRLDKLEK